MKSRDHQIQTKTVLAEKYERLSALTSSKPRRENLYNKAARYRRQVERLREQKV